jgi:hypothetical protein
MDEWLDKNYLRLLAYVIASDMMSFIGSATAYRESC